ncbi:MAG: hypothetical protein NWF03_00475 [Candidatus Bathyarchaeota archaeon]|nr:hypothetical protein [Candidatus Bathyarchaeota archaeon]
MADEDSWVTKEPMAQSRYSFGVAVVDQKIYALGGYATGVQGKTGYLDTVEEYDPNADTWTTKSSMPFSRSGFGTAVVDNKIYCIGGTTENNETASNQVYDPQTGTWENRTSMPSPREYVCANVVDDQIFVIGGSPTANAVEVYDPETDTWTMGAALPYLVSSYASAVVGDKIYVISDVTQIYDTKTGNWSLGTPPLYPVSYGAAAATTGVSAPERVYVFGGAETESSGASNQIYDPQTDNWTLGEAVPTPRNSAAVAVLNDTLYVIGGLHSEGIGPQPSTTTNEQYTPANYIPEFSAWLIVPLFVVATVVVIAVKSKVFRPT